jgi:hypothetical protein
MCAGAHHGKAYKQGVWHRLVWDMGPCGGVKGATHNACTVEIWQELVVQWMQVRHLTFWPSRGFR